MKTLNYFLNKNQKLFLAINNNQAIDLHDKQLLIICSQIQLNMYYKYEKDKANLNIKTAIGNNLDNLTPLDRRKAKVASGKVNFIFDSKVSSSILSILNDLKYLVDLNRNKFSIDDTIECKVITVNAQFKVENNLAISTTEISNIYNGLIFINNNPYECVKDSGFVKILNFEGLDIGVSVIVKQYSSNIINITSISGNVTNNTTQTLFSLDELIINEVQKINTLSFIDGSEEETDEEFRARAIEFLKVKTAPFSKRDIINELQKKTNKIIGNIWYYDNVIYCIESDTETLQKMTESINKHRPIGVREFSVQHIHIVNYSIEITRYNSDSHKQEDIRNELMSLYGDLNSLNKLNNKPLHSVLLKEIKEKLGDTTFSFTLKCEESNNLKTLYVLKEITYAN